MQEKRNSGFFTEGFLNFGPNSIKNFADLFKNDFDNSGFENFSGVQDGQFSGPEQDYDEGIDTFIPTDDIYDDDETNINYAGDYYEGEGASSFESPNFIPDGPDFGTSFDRDTSYDSFSSYEDSEDDFHHTGPGIFKIQNEMQYIERYFEVNLITIISYEFTFLILGNDFSDNKPKREVFNGNHEANHANSYEPFQYDDGEFPHIPSVEQQPHQNRHHHPQPHHHPHNGNDSKCHQTRAL